MKSGLDAMPLFLLDNLLILFIEKLDTNALEAESISGLFMIKTVLNQGIRAISFKPVLNQGSC